MIVTLPVITGTVNTAVNIVVGYMVKLRQIVKTVTQWIFEKGGKQMKYTKVIKPSLDMLMAEIEKRYVPYRWEIVNVFHADKKYCAVLTGGNRHPDIEDRFF